jgi:hypothetical protein
LETLKTIYVLLADGVYILALVVGVALFVGCLAGGAVARAYALPPLLTSLLLGAGRCAGVALCVYGGGSMWLQRHDASLEAGWTARQQAAVQAAVAAQRVAGDAAEVVAVQAAQKQAAATAIVRTVMIHDAKINKDGCAMPAPLSDAMAELLRRHPAPNRGGAPPGSVGAPQSGVGAQPVAH